MSKRLLEWTDKEIGILRVHADLGYTFTRIARLLNRGDKEVSRKATELGIKRVMKYGRQGSKD